MSLFAIALCVLGVVWVSMYALVKSNAYYRCVYNDAVIIFVKSKNLLFVDVVCSDATKGTQEYSKIPLLFFISNFEII